MYFSATAKREVTFKFVASEDKKYIIRDILLLINKFVALTVPSICNLKHSTGKTQKVYQGQI